MVTRDKLIFPLVFTQILRHDSVSYHKPPHFIMICSISVATIRRSEGQLQSKRPRSKMVTPPASFALSTFASSSSESSVTLEAVMVQFNP